MQLDAVSMAKVRSLAMPGMKIWLAIRPLQIVAAINPALIHKTERKSRQSSETWRDAAMNMVPARTNNTTSAAKASVVNPMGDAR